MAHHLPLPIVDAILDYLDIDAQIGLGRHRRLPASRRSITGWRPRCLWNNSLMEWTLILPLPSASTQYVMIVDLLDPRFVIEEWCLVHRTAPSWHQTLSMKFYPRID